MPAPVPKLTAVPDAAPPYDCHDHGAACRPPGHEPTAVRAVPVPSAVPPIATDSETAWPRQCAQAIVETIAGTRPFRQVLPSATERAQAQIQRLVPLLRADSGARIQRILASPAGPGVVEVTVIARFGPRTRALALRFEHIPGRPAAPGLPTRAARWLCTDIETA